MVVRSPLRRYRVPRHGTRASSHGTGTGTLEFRRTENTHTQKQCSTHPTASLYTHTTICSTTQTRIEPICMRASHPPKRSASPSGTRQKINVRYCEAMRCWRSIADCRISHRPARQKWASSRDRKKARARSIASLFWMVGAVANDWQRQRSSSLFEGPVPAESLVDHRPASRVFLLGTVTSKEGALLHVPRCRWRPSPLWEPRGCYSRSAVVGRLLQATLRMGAPKTDGGH